VDPGALIANLGRLPDAYRHWIRTEQGRARQPAGDLTEHREAAEAGLADCERACDRIADGVALL
jgi:hypothetical protein